jgi:hypothetical protein
MAICSALTGGLSKSCETNAGGVNKIFITDFDNVSAANLVIATSSTYPSYEWINGVTMSNSAKFWEIQTNKNVCNFTENVAIDMANGTTFFNQVVTLDLSRRETTKRAFIESLVAGQKSLRLIVLDSNGIYWLFGQVEGAYVTAVEGGSGTAKADKNGYTVTFTAMEAEQAYQVNPSIISTITA